MFTFKCDFTREYNTNCNVLHAAWGYYVLTCFRQAISFLLKTGTVSKPSTSSCVHSLMCMNCCPMRKSRYLPSIAITSGVEITERFTYSAVTTVSHTVCLTHSCIWIIVAFCKDGCRNGGACIAANVCACPQGFTGPSCETGRTVISPWLSSSGGQYHLRFQVGFPTMALWIRMCWRRARDTSVTHGHWLMA